MGSIFLPPAKIVYFTDQPKNGHFVILMVCNEKLKQNSIQIFEFDQKSSKNNFTDQNMSVRDFPGWSVKYT